MFIDSIKDQRDATWIGKLAVIPGIKDDGTAVIFNSVDQEVEVQNQGVFKASVIAQININSHDNVTVKFTKGMIRQDGNPRVRVIYSKQVAIFDVTFYSNHLDIDWIVQEKLMENSHGLMGKYYNYLIIYYLIVYYLMLYNKEILARIIVDKTHFGNSNIDN